MTDLTTTSDSAAIADLRRRAAEPDAPLRALLAERLGVAEDANVAAMGAALDRMLAERPAVPEGSELVDSEAVAELRADAELARNFRRDRLIADAVTTGRIPPAARSSWKTLFDTDAASAEAALRRIPANTIPVRPLGRSGDADDYDTGRELFGWT